MTFRGELSRMNLTQPLQQCFTVDVWFSYARPPVPPHDWRRYIVAADTALDAELIACQMAFRHGIAVASVVVDWEM